jgi:hypothetical protein
MERPFWQSLLALLISDAISFGVECCPPPQARHQPYLIDWVCLAHLIDVNLLTLPPASFPKSDPSESRDNPHTTCGDSCSIRRYPKQGYRRQNYVAIGIHRHRIQCPDPCTRCWTHIRPAWSECHHIPARPGHGRHRTRRRITQQTMFREKAFADSGTARQQAARGTFDPTHLN